jgi:iron complex outermembrane receptor protein
MELKMSNCSSFTLHRSHLIDTHVRRVCRRALVGVASCTLAALALPAFAQDVRTAAVNSPTEASGTDEVVLNDIVVTARRREESLQQTPISITSLSGQDIQQRGVDDLLDLGAFIPNLSVGGGGTGPSVASFVLRGIGSVRSGIEDEAPVAVYVDDVFLGSLDGALLQVIEPKRIEVLRGPQGTLFGKNALGGAIQYISQEPKKVFDSHLKATFGRFDRKDLSGYMDIPLGEKISTRLTGAVFTRDGTVESLQTGRDSNDIDTRFIRADTLWTPTANLSVRLFGDLTTYDTNGDGNLLIAVNPADSRVRRYLNSGRDLRLDLTGDDFDNNSASRTFRDENVAGGGLSINWQIRDGLRFKSISSYRKNNMAALTDRDATRYSFFEQLEDRKQHQLSQELQLLGDELDNRLNWIMGLYYFKETPSNSRVRLEELETTGAPLDEFFQEHNDSRAVFGEATYRFTDLLSFTAGARYTSEEKKSFATSHRRNDPAPPAVGNGSDTFTNFSPRGVLQEQWTSSVMTYQSISKGFRSGGFNNRFNAALPNNGFIGYEAETLTNYEVGLRSDLLGRRLRVNLSAFHAKYDNLQLPIFFGATATTFTTNAGAAEIDGAELEGSALVSRHFRFDYGVAYLDPRYTDLGNVQAITLNTPFPRAPKWSYNAGAQFDYTLAGGYAMLVRADYGYKAKQALVPTDDQNIFQDAYGLLNARVELAMPNDRFRVALYGTNLTDERYFTTAQRNRGLDMVTLGDPREYGISLIVNF